MKLGMSLLVPPCTFVIEKISSSNLKGYHQSKSTWEIPQHKGQYEKKKSIYENDNGS
jgi:hypothetical protein